MRISDWSSDVCSSDLFARLDQVVHIGTAVGPAGRTGAAFVDRAAIFRMAGIAQVERTIPGKGLSVTTGARRQDAIEHVDSALDCANQIIGLAHAHEIARAVGWKLARSEENTSELQSLMRTQYAVLCL